MKTRAIISVGFLSLMLLGCTTGGPAPEYYRVTEDDVRILEEARALLSDESTWAHNEDQQCDLSAQTWTLFCALQKASTHVLGEFQLRRPALEETRYAIDAQTTGELERRLIDFNNLPTTTFEDVQRVLDQALVRIRARLASEASN